VIFTRLYELSVRKQLAADPAFEDVPVRFMIKLGNLGEYLGIEERQSQAGTVAPRLRDRSLAMSVPRAHGRPNTPGFARFLADSLARVLPCSAEERSARSRSTFWKQIDRAAYETRHPSLQALQHFGQSLGNDDALVERLRRDVQLLHPSPNDRCTFTVTADCGQAVVEIQSVRDWFREFYESVNSSRQAEGPTGVCQVTGTVTPLPFSHPSTLKGVPGGLPTGVSIVSCDKAAFESYGLKKAANAGIGHHAAEGYLRALTALMEDKVEGLPRSSLRIGNTVFLYWTRHDGAADFMHLLENPDPAQLKLLLASADSDRRAPATSRDNDFFLVALSGNAARAIVRDYMEAQVDTVRSNLARWFRDLRIADTSREGRGNPSSRFPLWMLAAATAGDVDQVSTYMTTHLLNAALKGTPVCDSVLAACLRHLRVLGGEGFRPARMALLKLILLRRNIFVTEQLNPQDDESAYICGRLMAIFEQIQHTALGVANANGVEKLFSSFCSAPGLLLGQLYTSAQSHLRQIRSERPDAYEALDQLLTETSHKLRTLPSGQLTPADRCKLALGYYHQKARRIEESAQRKKTAGAGQGIAS
jgi:CRISPR-associated protein Csd1